MSAVFVDASYCIATNVMEAEGITDVLTSDHHFKQEGFTILMDSTS